MNAPDSNAKLDAIKDALFRGRKVEAIKLYRESIGGGLKDAKEAIERLEAELRVTAPERFTANPPTPAGPVILALVLAVVVALIVVSLLLMR